jgi:DNA-binding NtrC family response regulator
MRKKRILATWIGNNDLRAMLPSLPAKRKEEILSAIGGAEPKPGEAGPIRTLVEAQPFDELLLLSNYSADWNCDFTKWLGGECSVSRMDLSDPTDYSSIFQLVDAELKKLKDRSDWANTELCIHLSPGSPAMTAVWVLLGKSRYPATFYQTYKGRAWVTEIPFDLAFDFVPELLRDPDTHFQHLASQSPSEVAGFEQISGDSKAIRVAVGRAKRAAMRGVSILILGESGTGKEMFARAIHKASPRRDKPFIPINCAAISRDLLESELFGHKKGAFTGAASDRKGAFEEANGGTIFLDEVGECDLATQAKLLRVLQPLPGHGPCLREYRRVGEAEERTTDVRLIAATNKDLLVAVNEHQFREDLFYRLAVVTLKLPALRDRKGDIPKITEHLLRQINDLFRMEENGYRDKKLSDGATAFVKRHRWPGNVRQLQNALVQAAVLADGGVIDRRDIMDAVAELSPPEAGLDVILNQPIEDGFSLTSFLEDVQRKYLRRAMTEADGIKTRAAKLLGYSNYQTLAAQLDRLGIKEPSAE